MHNQKILRRDQYMAKRPGTWVNKKRRVGFITQVDGGDIAREIGWYNRERLLFLRGKGRYSGYSTMF